jgi:hypothetical protein
LPSFRAASIVPDHVRRFQQEPQQGKPSIGPVSSHGGQRSNIGQQNSIESTAATAPEDGHRGPASLDTLLGCRLRRPVVASRIGCRGVVVSNRRVHVVLSTDSLSLPRPWYAKTPFADPDKAFRYSSTYPALLQNRLSEALPAAVVTVTNVGEPSATMLRPAQRAFEFISLMEPSALLVQHGIVDCWLESGDPANVKCPIVLYEQYIQTVLKVRDDWAPGLPVIIVGILPVGAEVLEKMPEQNAIVARYNKVLRRQARPGIHFVDMELLQAESAEDIVHLDGCHLSRHGHALLALTLSGILTGYFGEGSH